MRFLAIVLIIVGVAILFPKKTEKVIIGVPAWRDQDWKISAGEVYKATPTKKTEGE